VVSNRTDNKAESNRVSREARKRDTAARAAWLYYIAGNTQEEIARRMSISRPAVQRLIAQATSEGLIKMRLDHPISACMELAEELQQRFELGFCQVVPSDPAHPEMVKGLAVCAADCLESYLVREQPVTLALGTGRAMRMSVDEVSTMQRPQHRIVSLVGTMALDGSASPYEVVMRLADRVGAQRFPMAAPVIAGSPEDRETLFNHPFILRVRELVAQADAAFVGVGHLQAGGPLHTDGFITAGELADLQAHGAVGDILGWAFDREGQLIRGSMNLRVVGVPLPELRQRPLIGVAGGPRKVPPLRAALGGRLLWGLITDEVAARGILDRN